MNKIMNLEIIPFVGIGEIKLYSNINDIKEYLKNNNVDYSVEIQSNKGCQPEVPWVLFHINDSITLMFANDKLWQIYFENKYNGSLSNGVKIGTPIEDALKIDSSLKYDDWNEDYESNDGYWIEDNLDDQTVMSIAIFIKEVLDEEQFNKYEW